MMETKHSGNPTGKMVFVVGLPGSGKSRFIDYIVSGDRFFKGDWINNRCRGKGHDGTEYYKCFQYVKSKITAGSDDGIDDANGVTKSSAVFTDSRDNITGVEFDWTEPLLVLDDFKVLDTDKINNVLNAGGTVVLSHPQFTDYNYFKKIRNQFDTDDVSTDILLSENNVERAVEGVLKRECSDDVEDGDDKARKRKIELLVNCIHRMSTNYDESSYMRYKTLSNAPSSIFKVHRAGDTIIGCNINGNVYDYDDMVSEFRVATVDTPSTSPYYISLIFN